MQEQPLTGFDYSYWFKCTECGERVNIAADLYELQTTHTSAGPQAEFSRCGKCGTPVDICEVSPVLRDPNDVALQDDKVDRLFWYHTSQYKNWPDAEAYVQDYNARMAGARPLAGFDPEQLLKRHISLAVHIGTYAAAIDNMLRRRADQDDRHGPPVQYWLHRVQIELRPGDLAPHVEEELSDWVGNVPLSKLCEYGGARAIRYVNTNEAHGTISVAIHPAVVVAVSTIQIPLESVADETSAAATAAAAAATALRELEPLRPDTTGIDRTILQFPSMLDRAHPDHSDPERQRIEAIVQQHRAYHEQRDRVWTTLTRTLESEYLPTLNPHMRERFYGALPRSDDPNEYHYHYRLLAALLARPSEIISALAQAPTRII